MQCLTGEDTTPSPPTLQPASQTCVKGADPLLKAQISLSRDVPGGSDGKEAACNAGVQGSFNPWVEPLEEGMATQSSILAWRSPWTEDPGGLYGPWGLKESDMIEQLIFLTVF